MPGISGLEVIQRIHDTEPTIVVVVITGYATIATAVDAMKAGAYDFLPKPFKPDELRLIVRRGLERRRLEMAARQAEMERELLKRRFVTFVSHQLKSPLVAIHQYLDVLKRLGDSEEARAKRDDWLDRCLKRSEELQGIINDWLTLAKIEGETLSRQHVRVDLNEIIPGTVKTYEELAAADDIALSVTMPDEACVVLGDRNCLAVLFDNLIVNAIKYNKTGGAVLVTGEHMNEEVVVTVEDTGVGISPEYCERLFDEFFRVKDSKGKKTTGTGLGLPICKKIVSEHDGSIEVESEPDVGSTFRVRLPAYREIRSARGAGEA
jgi:signal transduction histidine kinase